MRRLVFKVLAPAMMPGPMGAQVSDSALKYVGSAHLLSGSNAPQMIGGAKIIGGTKVGNKRLGCTYIKPPFVIPGFGEVEEM